MSETTPATDEQIGYIDGLDYGSISWQFANELVARIRADGEQIAELKRDFAAYRAAMNPDDDAVFENLYHRPMLEMKRRVARDSAALARLADALRFYAEGWPPGVEWDGGARAGIALSELETK